MTTYVTSREIPAPVEEVFAAMSSPERLARWWGPAGFSNTFEVCEFRRGGTWLFTMHGPDGRNFRNESQFEEIDCPKRVVVRHVSEPKYRLTIALESCKGGTLVSWARSFDRPRVGERLRQIVVPANEQNMDRLTAEVSRSKGVD